MPLRRQGASDFPIKPYSQTELLRVWNLLEVQRHDSRLRELNLEQQLAEGTRDLEQARLEMLVHLALAAEYRDDDTQEHAWRVGRTSGLLALALGFPDTQVELIWRAAPLHDIGKIGIPDAILLNPGKLTPTEFAVMKTHVTIGAEILAGSQSPLLRLAERIALTHHERWDGRGYPRRQRGEKIPLAGRIVAVADVFDALTHERPYKKASAVSSAVAEILSQRGRQFDPGVVDAFASLDHPTLLKRVREWRPGTLAGVRARSRIRGKAPLSPVVA
jgi:putative two-component system response regulator